MNVPLPPSESSHQGHYPSEAEGDSAVVENVSSNGQHRSRQEPTVTAQKSSSVTQPPISSGAMCGACGTSVKGQYVRAMGKIYHLDCFRCRVSLAAISIIMMPITESATGLQSSRCGQILPRGRSGRLISTVRARLLRTSRPHLRQVRQGPPRRVHHRLQPEIPRRTLYMFCLPYRVWPARFLL